MRIITRWQLILFDPAHLQIKKKRKRKGLDLDAPEVVIWSIIYDIEVVIR